MPVKKVGDLCRVCALGSPRSKELGLTTYPLQEGEVLIGFDSPLLDEPSLETTHVEDLMAISPSKRGIRMCLHGSRISFRVTETERRKLGAEYREVARQIREDKLLGAACSEVKTAAFYRQLSIIADMLQETGPFHPSALKPINVENL